MIFSKSNFRSAIVISKSNCYKVDDSSNVKYSILTSSILSFYKCLSLTHSHACLTSCFEPILSRS